MDSNDAGDQYIGWNAANLRWYDFDVDDMLGFFIGAE